MESASAQNQNNELLETSKAIYQGSDDIKTSLAQTTDDYAEELKKEKQANNEAEKAQRQADDEKKKSQKEEEAFKKSVEKSKNALSQLGNETDKSGSKISGFGLSTTKAAAKIITFGSVVSLMRRALSQSISTIKDLDKAFTNMAIVTSMSRKEAWELRGTMEELANVTGKTTSEIAEITTMYLQQGKSLSQAKELTEATARAATIAGISGSDSVNLLTNAMNGFQLSANKAMEVSDKFAALAASSATNYEELATALSKVAAQANLAGMSMDFTLGLLAKGVETTREAPETIGTALKTVISRMRELTDYESTLEDGTDVNRVEKALSNVGIALRDSQGQFRDLENVLTELGMKWNDLNKNQQANVAVALAGTRQQSRLIAMMQNFDRTLELVDESANSYGATIYQSGKYAEGLEASINRLTVAWQSFTSSIVDSDLVIGVVNTIQGFITFVSDNINTILIPAMVIVGSMLLSQLNTKMQEYTLTRLENQEKERSKELAIQERLNQIEIEKQQVIAKQKQLELDQKEEKNKRKTKIHLLENLIANKEITKEIKKQNVLNNKNLSEEEKRSQLQEIDLKADKDIAIYKGKIAEIKAEETEENALNVEYQNLCSEQARLQDQLATKQLANIPLIGGALSNVLGIWTSITTMMKSSNALQMAANALQIIFNKEKRKEYIQTIKNAAATKLQAAAEKIKAAWGMATSASSIPYVGWVIGLTILAAILGAGIAAIVKSYNAQSESIENTKNALEEQQAQLYELNKSIKTVSSLADEFENLSNKIVKSTEDLERLEEIAKQVNDNAGKDIIDLNADYETQLAQIVGYQAELEAQKQKNIESQRNTLFSGYKTQKAFGEKWGFDTSAEAYLEKLGSAGEAALRTLGNNLITQLGDFSQETVTIMTNAYASLGAKLLTGEMTDEKFLNTYRETIYLLDEATKNNSLSDYYKALSILDENQRKVLTSSNAMLDGIEKLGKIGALDKLEAAGYKLNNINELFSVLKSTIIGTEAEVIDAFGSIIKGINSTTDSFAEDLYYKTVEQIKANRDALIKARTEGSAEYINLTTEKEKLDKKAASGNLTNDERTRLGELTQKIAKFDNAEGLANEAINQLNNTLLKNNAISNYTDEMTKLSSSLENFTKINNIANMSLKEQQDLLDQYPELLGSMEKGALDVGTAMEILNGKFEETKKNLETDIDNIFIKYDANDEILKGTGIAATDFANEEVMRKYYDMGRSEFTVEMLKKGITEANTNKIWADIVDSVQKNRLLNQMEEQGITYALDVKLDLDVKSNINKRLDQELELNKQEMDLLSEGTEEYKKALEKRNDILSQKVNNNIDLIDKDKSKLRELFGEKVSNEDYKAITGAFDIVNGKIITNTDAFNKLTREQKDYYRASFSFIEQYAEEQKNANDEIYDSAKELAENLIGIEKQKFNSLKDELEKKQELYGDYWEKIDALEEEQNNNTKRDSLLNQLSALAGGSGSATNALRKDLLNQIEDLNAEQIKAQKEAQRNALTQKIDDEVESIDNKMDVLDQSLKDIVTAIINNPNQKIEFDEKGNLVLTEQNKVTENAEGGIVDYTGYAWVDGTKTKPEAFLNDTQTLLIGKLATALSSQAVNSSDLDTSTSVNIEKIEIVTNQLNEEQDFRNAGQILGEEIAAAAKRRGLNINVKR